LTHRALIGEEATDLDTSEGSNAENAGETDPAQFE
jgi:hypothetical protein